MKEEKLPNLCQPCTRVQPSPLLRHELHIPKNASTQHTAQSPALCCCRKEGKSTPAPLTCLKDSRTGTPRSLWVPEIRKECCAQ